MARHGLQREARADYFGIRLVLKAESHVPAYTEHGLVIAISVVPVMVF